MTREFGEIVSMTKRRTIPPKLKLKVLNRDNYKCQIEMIPNTINGYHASFNMGIYTNNDNGGARINFEIKKQN